MAAVAIALALPATAPAQAAAPSGVVARPSETVRVRTAQWEYTGTLAHVARDTAVIRFSGDSAVVARSSVLHAQVQRGTRRSTPRILITTLVGGVAGTYLGAAAGVLIECGGSCADNDSLDGLAGGLAGATIGMVTGAVAGGVWGARKRYPRWLNAALPFSD